MTDSPWHMMRADAASWRLVNPLNDKHPEPPAWWTKCEGCGRAIAEHEEIGVQVVMGGLPNAVYCRRCSSER